MEKLPARSRTVLDRIVAARREAPRRQGPEESRSVCAARQGGAVVRRKNFLRRAAILAVPAFAILAFAQEYEPWKAPAEARAKQNPVAADAASLMKGAKLYARICGMCHGEKGDGDTPFRDTSAVPLPDFTLAKWQKGQTDGELFWKITKGRESMPGYERRYSDRERWRLVSYIRSFAQRSK